MGSAKTCLVALLACGACSADRHRSGMGPEQDGGWPRVRAPNPPDAGGLAFVCNLAEPRLGGWIANPEAERRAYAVRDAVCTRDGLKQGRTQCSFELGETRRKMLDDNDRAVRRVKRWHSARVKLSYRRVGGADHDWMESWWADGPCRP
ncbi:MAG TPA: hypothetical protein VF605_12070 [Allosphingosinicella sp.]|jgi:hypothetical protein